MASEKNITMKEFNGTDYDVLYPKTKTGQVVGLDGYIQSQTSSLYLRKSGDTMTGILNMNGNRITNIDSPQSTNDAVTKQYVDGKIYKITSQIITINETQNIRRNTQNNFYFHPNIEFNHDIIKLTINSLKFSVKTEENVGQDIRGELYFLYKHLEAITNRLYNNIELKNESFIGLRYGTAYYISDANISSNNSQSPYLKVYNNWYTMATVEVTGNAKIEYIDF